MNLSVLVKSLKYINNFKLIILAAPWIYYELKNVNYTDSKLIRSFKKQDYEVTSSIIHLISDLNMLSDSVNIFSNIGDPEVIIKILISVPIEVDISKYIELIDLACELNYVSIFKVLIQNKIIQKIYKDHLLTMALRYDRTQIASILMEI